MIKFRQKVYSSYEKDENGYDILPVEERFMPDPEIEKIYGKCIINLIESTEYSKQIPIPGTKDRIRKLRQDILDGYLYEDGPNGGKTHWLRRESTPGKSHAFSKWIQGRDRLNYIIQRPKVVKNKYVQTVHLVNRVGHGFKGKIYSDKS